MRGRIKLILTSVAVVGASAVAYHHVDQKAQATTAAPTASSPVASVLSVPPAVQPVHKAALHPIRAVLSTLGMASFYNDSFAGKRTANGETFNQELLTACHRTLPFGTLVRVINVATGRSVIVRINDRGAMSPSRVIDLSHAAASEIGMLEKGVAKVRLEILGKAKAAEAHPL